MRIGRAGRSDDGPARTTDAAAAPIRWHGSDGAEAEPGAAPSNGAAGKPDTLELDNPFTAESDELDNRFTAETDELDNPFMTEHDELDNPFTAEPDELDNPFTAERDELDLALEERVDSVIEAAEPDGGGLGIPAGESEALDLDRFFMSLRANIHRDGLPAAPRVVTTAPTPPVDAGPVEPHAPDPLPVGPASKAPAPEHALRTETDADHWRGRAIVWRERALAAEALAKALQQSVDDLRESVEDLRTMTRLLSDASSTPPPIDVGSDPGALEATEDPTPDPAPGPTPDPGTAEEAGRKRRFRRRRREASGQPN